MSYDILVFDPAAVSDADFSAWWEEQSAWPEDHSYSDPAVTTPELRAFYADMRQRFPDMDALTDEELDANPGLEDRMIEYTIGTRLIYMAFPWSRAEQAGTAVETTALRHGVAIAWVSESTTTVPIQRP